MITRRATVCVRFEALFGEAARFEVSTAESPSLFRAEFPRKVMSLRRSEVGAVYRFPCAPSVIVLS